MDISKIALRVIRNSTWKHPSTNSVNNQYYDYDKLGDRWYTAKDGPVALLRAQSRVRNTWIVTEIRKVFSEHPGRPTQD